MVKSLSSSLIFSNFVELEICDNGVIDDLFASLLLFLHEFDHVLLVEFKALLQALDGVDLVSQDEVVFLLEEEDLRQQILNLSLQHDVLGFVQFRRNLLQNVGVQVRQYFE